MIVDSFVLAIPSELLQAHDEACIAIRSVLRINRKGRFGNSDLPINRSLHMPLDDIARGDIPNAMRNILLLRFFEKHLKEVRLAAPEIIENLRKRLLSPTLSDYLGARCELDIAASLIRANTKPKKRESPDFEVSAPDGPVFLECTHAFLEQEKTDPVESKLRACITKYGAKRYINNSTVLVVEATNLVFRSAPIHGVTIPDELRKKLSEELGKLGIGSLLIFVHIFDDEIGRLHHRYSRIDSSDCSKRLMNFLNEHYPYGEFQVENWAMPARPA